MTHSFLIEKHLLDGLSAEEAAVLEAAVGSDPTVAGRLVAAALMDQRLSARLGPSRSAPAGFVAVDGKPAASPAIARWRQPLALAAALALILGLAAALAGWIRTHGQSRSEIVSHTLPATPKPFVPPPVVLLSDRAAGPPPVENETPAMASLRRLLSNYYLTGLQLETARPLDQALERLLERARALNHLKNPMIERLTAELPAPDVGEDRPSVRVSLPLPDVSLMDGLKWFAALARSEIFLKEPGVVTFRPWEWSGTESLVTEVVPVRTGLLTQPIVLESGRVGIAESLPSSVGADRSLAGTETRAVQPLTPVGLFQSWGIAFSARASAAYDETTAAMTICHTPSSLRMIKEMLAVENSRSRAMVQISSRVLELAEAPAMTDGVVTDSQLQSWLEELGQTGGSDILSAPSIVVRSGQQAMVEVVEETSGPGAGAMSPLDSETDWQGLRLPLESRLEGEVVKVIGAVELRLPTPRQPLSLTTEDAPRTNLVTQATDFEVVVPPGQTAVFSLNQSSDGPYYVIAMTVHGGKSDVWPAAEPNPSRGAAR